MRVRKKGISLERGEELRQLFEARGYLRRLMPIQLMWDSVCRYLMFGRYHHQCRDTQRSCE